MSDDDSSDGIPMSEFLGCMADGFDAETGVFDGFGSLSETASHVTSPVGTVRRLIETAGLTREHRFVDLGCGRGAVNNVVAELVGCRCLGVDLSRTELDVAEEDARARGVEGLVRYEVARVEDATPLIERFAAGDGGDARGEGGQPLGPAAFTQPDGLLLGQMAEAGGGRCAAITIDADMKQLHVCGSLEADVGNAVATVGIVEVFALQQS